ncbi:MAG: hypothetical protein LAO08_03545 [Acidobacteriia bacterium]|nr:hypothetical protein [Terriglobia bacterium]
MNWAHIHLVLTHIPVIGIGAIIAFLLIGKIRGSREIEWVGLQMFVALALLSIAVYLTGSPASHQMRALPGISRETIHRHSSVADFAFGGLEVLGALSLGALIKFRSTASVPARFMSPLLALAFAVLLMMIWTANLGGRIRHPEIDGARSVERTSML